MRDVTVTHFFLPAVRADNACPAGQFSQDHWVPLGIDLLYSEQNEKQFDFRSVSDYET